MDLEAVRAAACAFIGHNTIIVGHGYIYSFVSMMIHLLIFFGGQSGERFESSEIDSR